MTLELLYQSILEFKTSPWKAGDPKSMNRELHDNLENWLKMIKQMETKCAASVVLVKPSNA